ncbi:syntaxin binding protein 6 (amisyn), like isoform X3 [Triplophysa dalaica]|uniref:syntaxin binding protein 6 (amisyn), like isoform X3 n=1 Tax=Triplophysa dalaica TaxID=1582913 RepID=UPI0024DFCE1E|nr:syntaxin binding protein 6 (amisyn), like isoform X3 [Triplophysa dalaica]
MREKDGLTELIKTGLQKTFLRSLGLERATKLFCYIDTLKMNIQSAISREIFIPSDEKLLVAIEVRRRIRRKLSFLKGGLKKDYLTFLCLSVNNSRPAEALITKVKRYRGTRQYFKRSQWSVRQLRQVNGVNPNEDSPEFDLVLDRTSDQWEASSAAEKCMFVQVLYHACKNYWEANPGQNNPSSPGDQKIPGAPEIKKSHGETLRTKFVNCQPKLMGAKPVKASKSSPSPPMVQKMGNVMRRASQVLSEHGERVMKVEDKTSHLFHGAKPFSAAQKLALKQI